MSGPATWTQPLFGADAVPHAVINGLDIDFEFAEFAGSNAEEQGVMVETSGGQWVTHALLEDALAPLTIARMELDWSWQVVSEEVYFAILRAVGLARGGLLTVWIDRPVLDLWIADGAATTCVLSRSTGYATSGVSWAVRPARCFVDQVEQAMVTGTPSSGQCQLSQTTDETSIVLGDVHTAGAQMELRYYPLLTQITVDHEISAAGFGDASGSLTLTEGPPVRAWS